MTSKNNPSLLLTILASAASGVAVTLAFQKLRTKKSNPETDPQATSELVWGAIGGAVNAAMLYTGDRLQIYSQLRQMCQNDPKSYVTAISLAEATGYNQRWLREWLAQQAAMGILVLLPPPKGKENSNEDADLHYRLPKAAAEVLANPESPHYDIAMVQMVPALVHRAKTMLPEAFQTGIGRPYDDPDVSEAIDRHHAIAIREAFIPKILKPALNGGIVAQLEKGCNVSDLGCGAGVMLLTLAKAYPISTFHGYEVSQPALEKAAYNLASSRLKNVFFHDATQKGESLGDCKKEFDICITYDVLHDCTNPADLIQQVKVSLKERGSWLLADIPAKPTIRENLKEMPAVATYFSFSTCLCMSCSLSEKGGAGLGTLGFSVPVARKLIVEEGGFDRLEVLCDNDGKNARWFLVQ